MAKISAHGKAFAVVLSPSTGRLFSFHEDGVTLVKSVHSPVWKLHARLKAGNDLAAWKERRLAKLAGLPEWARKTKSLPSLKTLERWHHEDGGCETPSGDMVEADGTGPDGAPSWLRLLGMI